jgi:hypothetical protein
MSRGRGWVQQEILATLDDAKAAPLHYRGGRAHFTNGVRVAALEAGPGWVITDGANVDLPDGVYDLRASCRFLAERHGKTHKVTSITRYPDSSIDPAFQVSFSRAAKSLIERGDLLWCDHQGRVVVGHEARLAGLARRHRRFVRRTEEAPSEGIPE